MARKLEPVCPAAELIDGPPDAGPAVLCGVMRQRQTGLDRILNSSDRGVVLTARDDPSSFRLCCGTGVPVQDAETLRNHYTACPLWQLRKELDWSEDDEPEEPSLRDIVSGEALG